MDDLKYGTRNKRGDWSPNEPVEYAPLFTLPFKLKAFLKWLPHYFLPWNVLFALSAIAYWAWIIPPVETMQALSWGWPLWLYAVNAVATFLFYGAFELHLYVLKRQERRFKYNGKFPAEQKSKAFWFEQPEHRQYPAHLPFGRDDLDRRRGRRALGLREWLCALAELCRSSVSISRRSRSSCRSSTSSTFSASTGSSTRQFLYKWVHSVHHNSVNPSPWSSLSMHPVEHMLYFSTAFYHLIIPVEPGHRPLPVALCCLRRDPRTCGLRQDRGGGERACR